MNSAIPTAAHAFEAAADAAAAIGLDEASGLPDWSRRQVIAHVTLNAEAFVHIADDLRRGADPAFMYPGSPDRRDLDIEQLVRAPTNELFARLRSANDSFAAAWSTGSHAGRCATAPGHPEFSPATIPLRRLRELQVHMIDLSVDTITPNDWLDEFVSADLPLQWPTIEHRTGEPVAAADETGRLWAANPHDGGAITPVDVSRPHLLAWVLDRADIAALPTLLPWRNRSSWEHTER